MSSIAKGVAAHKVPVILAIVSIFSALATTIANANHLFEGQVWIWIAYCLWGLSVLLIVWVISSVAHKSADENVQTGQPPLSISLSNIGNVGDSRSGNLSSASKNRLGSLLKQGEALMRLPDDELRAREWATEAHDFIRDEFGEGEANLFLSDAGYTFFAGQRGRVHLWLEGRVRRLTDLIRRL